MSTSAEGVKGQDAERFELAFLAPTWGTVLRTVPFLAVCVFYMLRVEPWTLKLLFGWLAVSQAWFLLVLFLLRQNYIEVGPESIHVRTPLQRVSAATDRIVGIKRSEKPEGQHRTTVTLVLHPPCWELLIVFLPLVWRVRELQLSVRPEDVERFLTLLQPHLANQASKASD